MAEYISKSERKRRFRQEEQVAEELAQLSPKQIAKLPAEDEVKQAVRDCCGLKGSALKRQIKYLAKVMRTGDVDALFSFLEERRGSDLKANRLHHEAEHLRDTIVNEAVEDQQECARNGISWGEDWPSDELDGLERRFVWLAVGDVRRAAYLYVRTKKHTHYKELFRIIKAALEREEMEKKRAR